MGKKSERREARIFAAKERDGKMFSRGLIDEPTLQHLRRLPEYRRREVMNHALSTVSRPMNPHRDEALVVLGAMATLAQEAEQKKQQEAAG